MDVHVVTLVHVVNSTSYTRTPMKWPSKPANVNMWTKQHHTSKQRSSSFYVQLVLYYDEYYTRSNLAGNTMMIWWYDHIYTRCVCLLLVGLVLSFLSCVMCLLMGCYCTRYCRHTLSNFQYRRLYLLRVYSTHLRYIWWFEDILWQYYKLLS